MEPRLPMSISLPRQQLHSGVEAGCGCGDIVLLRKQFCRACVLAVWELPG